METSTKDFLASVLFEIATVAAQGAAYETWTDSFCRKKVSEAWTDSSAPMRKKWNRTISVKNLSDMTQEDLISLGFRSFNGKVTLVPLWAFNYIADGENLISINGKITTKGKDEIDLDVRFGCLAYGFLTKE